MLENLLLQPEFLQFMSLAIMLCMATIGVALGQGRISSATSKALYMQPSASNEISRVSLISMALCETALIMSLSVVFIVLFGQDGLTYYQAVAQCSLISVMGIVSLVGGYLSSYPAQASIEAIARQPFFTGNIMILMLITTLFIQTPILFGFLLALTISISSAGAMSFLAVSPFLGAGIAFGVGSIGPLIGLAHYAQAACTAIGLRRDQYRQIFSFTILCQAMIEAPILFAIIIAFLLVGADAGNSAARATAFIVTGFMMGIGTLAPGIASGQLTSNAVSIMVQHPEQQAEISRASFIGQVLIDTLPLYCLILSLVFIFFA